MTDNPSCVASKKPILIEKYKIAHLSAVCTYRYKQEDSRRLCLLHMLVFEKENISLTFNYIVGYQLSSLLHMFVIDKEVALRILNTLLIIKLSCNMKLIP